MPNKRVLIKNKFMKKAIIGIIGLLFTISIISCTNEKDFQTGKRQLESQGYTDVRSTGYSPFCKGEDDTYSTGFVAIDSKGYPVSGCITSGFLKGVSIRFQ